MREIDISPSGGGILFPQYAWQAIDLQTYEPGSPIGHGPTEAAAYQDLHDQLEDEEVTGCKRTSSGSNPAL
jgi:hypothetical protein